MRLTAVLLLALGICIGGLVGSAVLRPEPGLSEAEVRGIVAEALAATPKPATGLDAAAVAAAVDTALADRPASRQPVGQLDAATLNPMIESFLMENPRVLQRVSAALDAEVKAAQLAATKSALAELRPALFESPRQIVLGNPEGDVTLIEMFDYNCTYCRQALPDLAALLEEDKNLRVILKEFPILSQASVEAARVAVLVNDAKPDAYWQFHQTLFTSRGQVNKDTALKAAGDLGLSPVQLEMKMGEPDITAVIDESYDIAKKLSITGTPTYIIGNEVIPGAVGIDQLKSRIANMRACGETSCPSPG